MLSILTKLGFLALLFVCVHASRQAHASARYRTSTWMRSHREYLAEHLLTKEKNKKKVTSTTILLSSNDGNNFPTSWRKMRGGGGSSSLAQYTDSSSSLHLAIMKETDPKFRPLGTPVCTDLQQILAFTRAPKILQLVIPKDSTKRCFRGDASLPSHTRGLVTYPDGFVRPSFLGALLSEVVLFAGSHLETLHVALWRVAKKIILS